MPDPASISKRIHSYDTNGRNAEVHTTVLPEECVVVEDSRNGLLAAIQAGMKCIVTVSDYTREEDFSEASIVLTCLGEPGGEKCKILANRSRATLGEWFTIDDLEMVIEG